MVGVPDKMTSLWGYKVGIDNKLAAPEVETRGIQSYLQKDWCGLKFSLHQSRSSHDQLFED